MRVFIFPLIFVILTAVDILAFEKIPKRKEIDFFVKYYLDEDTLWFHSALSRYFAFRDIVVSILKKEGLPEELAILPIVESGYNGFVVSKSRAVGYWQFIRETARLYGLRRSKYVDEVRDLVASTKAAARYLRRLYSIFKDWELALAAYNAGEGRILRLMRATGAKSFWELVDSGVLRKETSDFVPRFYAILKIVRERLYRKELLDVDSKVDFIPVAGRFSLKEIALRSGVSYKSLRRLNPHLIRGVVPSWGARLYIYKKDILAVNTALSYMLAERRARELGIKIYRGYWRAYRVKRGDSLWKIARKFSTSIAFLKLINGLNGRLKVGQVILVPTGKLSSRIAYVSEKEGIIIYKVRRGDSLWKLSRLFGVKVRDIMRVNGVGRNLHPGQKVKIVMDRYGEVGLFFNKES